MTSYYRSTKMAELNLDQLKAKIREAKSVLVLLPPEPEADLVRSGLVLHQALKQAGKASIIGGSGTVSGITGSEEIKTAVGKRNLVISFPYKEEAVEHVSYDIDEATNRFNLIIRPKEGEAPLDTKQVEYNYTGAMADLVITLGIASLEELGRLYSDEKLFLDQAPIVSLRKGGQPADFAAFDLSGIRVTSLAELVFWFLRLCDLKITADQASDLYKQLLLATNNFQSPLVTAETFEVAAFLMRCGARTFQPLIANLPPAPFFPSPVVGGGSNHSPHHPQPRPKQVSPQVNNQASVSAKTSVPSDWQKPKIFRAGQGSENLVK